MLICWFDVFQVDSNQFSMIWVRIIRDDMILVGVIRVNVIHVDIIQVDVIRVNVIRLFNFKIILALSIFENSVTSRVFNYCRIIPLWPAHVGIIQPPPEGEVKAILSGNLCSVASDGSWYTPPKYSTLNFSTTLQTAMGDVLITMYLSINGSFHLVRLYDSWVNHRVLPTWYRTSNGLWSPYLEYFSPQSSIITRKKVFSTPALMMWDNWYITTCA